MLKKIVLAGATVAALAAAGLAPSAASAASPWNGSNHSYNGGGNYNGGNYNGGGYNNYPQPQQCTPITKTTRWWDRWGHVHFYTQVVGQTCVPVTPPPPPPRHGPFFPNHGGWGWGGW